MTDNDLKSAAESAFRKGFSGVIRIEPEHGAPFVIDGRGETCVITDIVADAGGECVWRAQSETLNRIFEGGRALESAYLSGRLKVSGDMSVMARLSLESSR